MLLFWRWKEVYFGDNLKTFAAIRNCLGAKGIRYHYRVVNQSHRGGLFGADKSRIYYGNLFTNKKVELLYYVYVKNKDYEDARYLLDCNHI